MQRAPSFLLLAPMICATALAQSSPCAEALSAGYWYYGKASLELVEKFFEQEAKDGLIVW
jgi:hypothetical protein